MSWKDEVEEIEVRRRRAQELGGSEAVDKHHALGRLTVRERIDALLDEESFREFGATAGHAEVDGAGNTVSFGPSNLVGGTGRIADRPVVVGGDDFTVRGGAYTPASLKKSQYAESLAIRRRVPLVRLLEGGGASISGGYGRRGQSGYDLTQPPPMNLLAMEALAKIPVACAAMGPCAGFPAARLAASHFSVMTRDTAVVLTGGPALVERATGKKLTKEELGGWKVHLKSGVVNNVAEDEADALAQVRAFLSYLPANAWEVPSIIECEDPTYREEQDLLSIIPRERRKAYKVRKVIAHIVDRDSFFEIAPRYGRSQVTGLARVNGHAVGVLANDCMIYGGGMSADGAQKVRRFVELCDTFNLPILSLVDEPGFQIGPEAEAAGTIRYGMEAMFAVLQSQVPWFSVVLRKSFGVAQGIHYGRNGTVVAWPSMQSGALPVESGVHLAFGKDIAAANDPDARRAELEDEMFAAQSVFPRAEEFGVHELIDPRRTRPLLVEWVQEIQTELAGQLGPSTNSPRP
jgi:acetyl-CoA carboxylase carboxyltransferase component